MDTIIDTNKISEAALTAEQKAQSQPELKVPCEVYSRVVGYLRPLRNWNEGKQQEFRDRKVYRVD